MNSMLIALFALSVVAYSQAAWLGGRATLVGPGTPGGLIRGPAAAADLWGPDGSRIAASGAAGAVGFPPRPGGVVSAAVAPGGIALGAPGWIGGRLGGW
ncbi:uncharacterized protein LOC143204500 [Rhynchophorus ferrugineus]|uniref:Uncharacterized protein n=1 Tax=Rhynchophorus ferrugineus TaxID=354439 RepID=A0A834II25_RHYFE|nr:hypothetical protein GWI33_005005 [Rhynchophorus ferrugineus]